MTPFNQKKKKKTNYVTQVIGYWGKRFYFGL